MIFEGEEIKDELYVDLFIAAVRMKFAPKSKDELKNENLEKVQQEDDLRNQLASIEKEMAGEVGTKPNGKPMKQRKPEVLEQLKNQVEGELRNLGTLKSVGFVLVDFPANFA